MFTYPSVIRVLIVDDHTIVRRGIRAFLSQTGDIQIVGEAANGLEAIRLAEELEPDVILMDLLMPQMDGIEATRQILLRQPGMRVLVLTSFIHDEEIVTAIKAGALGYVLKDSDPFELVRSIYRVQRGEPVLDSKIILKLAKEMQETAAE
jgi:two-component system, NarL family, response regulator LiaR